MLSFVRYVDHVKFPLSNAHITPTRAIRLKRNLKLNPNLEQASLF